jgi:hypothetical protein
MVEEADGKEQILEKLPEWYRILRRLYLTNFDKDQDKK